MIRTLYRGARLTRYVSLAALSAISATSQADDGSHLPIDKGASLVVAVGQSVVLLGSEQHRFGTLLGYSTWKPEPAFERIFGPHTDQVWMFYGMFHEGEDSRWSVAPSLAAGFTFGYRKAWTDPSGKGLYFQLDWGGQISDRNSHDLPSVVNSTPAFGVGFLRPFGLKAVNVGAQYLHISNAGTTRHNRGDNFLLLTVNLRIR